MKKIFLLRCLSNVILNNHDIYFILGDKENPNSGKKEAYIC